MSSGGRILYVVVRFGKSQKFDEPSVLDFAPSPLDRTARLGTRAHAGTDSTVGGDAGFRAVVYGLPDFIEDGAVPWTCGGLATSFLFICGVLIGGWMTPTQ